MPALKISAHETDLPFEPDAGDTREEALRQDSPVSARPLTWQRLDQAWLDLFLLVFYTLRYVVRPALARLNGQWLRIQGQGHQHWQSCR